MKALTSLRLVQVYAVVVAVLGVGSLLAGLTPDPGLTYDDDPRYAPAPIFIGGGGSSGYSGGRSGGSSYGGSSFGK